MRSTVRKEPAVLAGLLPAGFIQVVGIAMMLSLLAAGGCGLTRRAAVSTMAPIIDSTITITYKDQDLDTVEKGMPANLLLIRGMCASSPGNRTLWTSAAQLYYSYAYAFVEDENPENASLLYRQGLTLGTRFLERGGWFHPAADLATFEKGLRKAKGSDAPILFWTLANWVSWIHIQQNDPAVLVELPYAEAALHRLIEIDPGFFEGMPHVMLGTLLTSKPAIAGGNPEEAGRQFDAAFAVSGRRLLLFQVLYARYYCRQTLDLDCFTTTLQEVLEAPVDLEPRYRLLNEVAKRKAARLMEMKDEWF
jgi:hypothetical protein